MDNEALRWYESFIEDIEQGRDSNQLVDFLERKEGSEEIMTAMRNEIFRAAEMVYL